MEIRSFKIELFGFLFERLHQFSPLDQILNTSRFSISNCHLKSFQQIKMEKIKNLKNKEYMKMAMLKHEETFKEQVYELHRLYRIQKQLMKNFQYNDQNRINANHHQKIQQNLDPAENFVEDEIVLTLGPSSYNRKMRRKTETPLNSDSGPSFSSSSSGSNCYTKNGREGQNWQNRRNISSGEEDEEEMKQNRLQHSPWLITALSLKH